MARSTLTGTQKARIADLMRNGASRYEVSKQLSISPSAIASFIRSLSEARASDGGSLTVLQTFRAHPIYYGLDSYAQDIGTDADSLVLQLGKDIRAEHIKSKQDADRAILERNADKFKLQPMGELTDVSWDDEAPAPVIVAPVVVAPVETKRPVGRPSSAPKPTGYTKEQERVITTYPYSLRQSICDRYDKGETSIPDCDRDSPETIAAVEAASQKRAKEMEGWD
jgi:hypothetical protein